MSHHRKLIAQCLAVLLALPLLYVASSGPVLRLALKQQIFQETAEKFYHPLLANWANPWRRGDPLYAYLNFWDVGIGYTIPGSHIRPILLQENVKTFRSPSP